MNDDSPEVPFTVHEPDPADTYLCAVNANELRVIRSGLGTLKSAARILGCQLAPKDLAIVDDLLTRLEVNA